jgi:hypothetical protein
MCWCLVFIREGRHLSLQLKKTRWSSSAHANRPPSDKSYLPQPPRHTPRSQLPARFPPRNRSAAIDPIPSHGQDLRGRAGHEPSPPPLTSPPSTASRPRPHRTTSGPAGRRRRRARWERGGVCCLWARRGHGGVRPAGAKDLANDKREPEGPSPEVEDEPPWSATVKQEAKWRWVRGVPPIHRARAPWWAQGGRRDGSR